MAGEGVIGITYWPPDLGPYLWHEYPADRVAADLHELHRLGFDTVRVHLAWDVFAPHAGRIDGAAKRNLEHLLGSALAAGVQVIPVIFLQAIGDCIMLPHRLVDHSARRGTMRIVSGGNLEPGIPRNVYSDPLLLESGHAALGELLDGFANHPAIRAWCLGHDVGTALRPRHVTDLVAWVALMAGTIHAAEDQVWLGLGAGDLVRARAVRPNLLAPLVDAVELMVMPQRLDLDHGFPGADETLFLLQVMQAMAGDVPVHLHVGVAARDTGPATPAASSRDPGVAALDVAQRHAAAVIEGAVALGAAGVWAWPSHRVQSRVGVLPPFDRLPSLAMAGLLGEGDADARAEVWITCARNGFAVTHAASGISGFDVEDYYAGLPESIRDLFEQWRRGRTARPDILS